jgi:tricorn protease
MSKVYLHSLEKGESQAVTDEWFASGSPAFSGDGVPVFVSSRDFKPTYSATEWNHVYLDMARIYFVTLAKDTLNLFRRQRRDTAKEERRRRSQRRTR